MFLGFPGDLTGLGVHRAQHADMVVKLLPDAETLPQIGGPLVIGDIFGPVIFRPVVGRDVEQAGAGIVGHGHPVGTAEEIGRDADALALVLARRWRRRALARIFDRPPVGDIPFAGPTDIGDEGINAERAALLLADPPVALGQLVEVGQEEIAVAVGMGARPDRLAVLLQIEQHDRVVARKIPGVVGRMLEEADRLARRRLDIDLTRRIEAVARRAFPRIPRRGVAGADDDGVGLFVIGGRLPRCAAAVIPGLDLLAVLVIGPTGRLGIAGEARRLAVQATLMPFHHRAHPNFLARVGIAGV
eukprot:Opistho-2@77035